jgi:hypothetical protein
VVKFLLDRTALALFKTVPARAGGFSTQLAVKALARNRRGRLTCIEPYPEARLLDAGLDIELIQKPVEQIDVAFFQSLDAGDILFIDSTIQRSRRDCGPTRALRVFG